MLAAKTSFLNEKDRVIYVIFLNNIDCAKINVCMFRARLRAVDAFADSVPFWSLEIRGDLGCR